MTPPFDGESLLVGQGRGDLGAAPGDIIFRGAFGGGRGGFLLFPGTLGAPVGGTGPGGVKGEDGVEVAEGTAACTRFGTGGAGGSLGDPAGCFGRTGGGIGVAIDTLVADEAVAVSASEAGVCGGGPWGGTGRGVG